MKPGSTLHVEEHPSPDTVLSSSHCSLPTMSPSPQMGTQQVLCLGVLYWQFQPGSS